MRSIGNIGEDIAEKYLLAKGAKILARNYTVRGGELDLIAELNDVVLFVEVKLRKTDAFGSIYETIPPSKQRRLSHAAKVYLQQSGLLDRKFARFDVIFIHPDGCIEHIERAFDYAE